MGRQNQCQNCGRRGHNRRSCPIIKEAHAKVKAAGEDYGVQDPNAPSGSPYVTTGWINDLNLAIRKATGISDSPEEINYRERWYWEEYEERMRAQARNVTRRTCGFCDEPGHNARTCEEKKQHRKDGDAMQGLAHRVIAACLEKAGLVPGTLMQFRDWDRDADGHVRKFGIVTGMDWSQIAKVGYDTKQGLPHNFEQWFSQSFIKIKTPADGTRTSNIPRNIPQQSSCRFSYHRYDTDAITYGIASPVLGGSVNKDKGWKGDNVTLISPSAEGLYRMSSDGIPDQDLQPIVEKLISDVASMWVDY